MRADAGGGLKVALVGYNGANNTGSEARLLKVIDDVRAVCGRNVRITVPSLNVANLQRYLGEDDTLRIEAIPSLYHRAIDRVVKSSDVMMLVEGSCYMDSWTPALLNAYLWATRRAYRHGRRSLAYAVDAGSLSPGNVRKVRIHASKTDLIIMRTFCAAERMLAWGVTAPIEVTADTAFDFAVPDPEDARTGLPRTLSGKVGIAPVDFYLWPVVARPYGRREDCYRWPYYFSRSSDRCEASMRLAAGLAKMADEIVERWDREIILIGMEELDEPLAREVMSRMRHQERAEVMSSNTFNAFQMTSALRELDALVTSRYHAAVLSMAAGVPAMAIGHDKRLDDLYGEIGLRNELFLGHSGDVDWKLAGRMLETIMEDGGRIRTAVRAGYRDQVARMARNRALLKEFMEGNG